MRVISQDAKMDLPYDIFWFKVARWDDRCYQINAHSIGNEDMLTVAEYMTEITAKDALRQMLSSYQIGCKTFKMPQK